MNDLEQIVEYLTKGTVGPLLRPFVEEVAAECNHMPDQAHSIPEIGSLRAKRWAFNGALGRFSLWLRALSTGGVIRECSLSKPESEVMRLIIESSAELRRLFRCDEDLVAFRGEIDAAERKHVADLVFRHDQATRRKLELPAR